MPLHFMPSAVDERNASGSGSYLLGESRLKFTTPNQYANSGHCFMRSQQSQVIYLPFKRPRSSLDIVVPDLVSRFIPPLQEGNTVESEDLMQHELATTLSHTSHL